MQFDWFNVGSITEFLDSGLPSREIESILGEYGLKTILLTMGNEFGVLFDGVFLVPDLNDRNPFVIDDRAAYISDDDLYVGVAIAD